MAARRGPARERGGRARVIERLFDLVLERDELAELDPAARRLALRALVAEAQGEAPAATVAELADSVDGLGPLAPLMREDGVTDVLVNGPDEVWVERDGRLERTRVRFRGAAALRDLVERALGEAGVRWDASQPIADGRLADGSRLHAVLPPVASQGPLVSIRRWPRGALPLELLGRAGFASDAELAHLEQLVGERRSVVVGGATGTGKTTLLNALLALVPATERVVTIEETPELAPRGGHTVSLLTRAPNPEGRGEVDMTALVRAALRMRPDRLVIGEVRGAEALTALAAMSTGHEGSMLTVHARSPAGALERLVELALQASTGAPHASIEAAVRRAVDAVVHLGRDDEGRRRVVAILDRERNE
jgi:pilus assembly protein CpaF